VARHIYKACPVWIYTQSNITSCLFFIDIKKAMYKLNTDT
jgi:hypothetical protein